MKRAVAVGVILGILVVVFTYLVTGRDIAVNQISDAAENSTSYLANGFRNFTTSSNVARRFRCFGSDAPRNPHLRPEETLITYTWTGGFGPGEVLLVVEAGTATVSLQPWGCPRSVTAAEIPEKAIVEIIDTAVDVGFFCQNSVDRVGYRVHDLGRYEINFVSNGFSKSLWIDGTTTVPDRPAFDAVLEKLFGLSEQIGVAFDWGPYGIASVPITTP